MTVRARVRRILLCALLALPLAACSGIDSGSSVPDSLGSSRVGAGPAPPTTRAVVNHTLPLVADLVRPPGGVLSGSGGTLVVESPGTALLAFVGPELEPECIESASLRVHAVRAEAPIDAWVSLETEVAQLPDGTDLGQVVIAHGSPRTTATEENGTFTWDVTEQLRWSRATQHTTSFVLALKTVSVTRLERRFELGAMETNRGAVVEVVERSPCA